MTHKVSETAQREQKCFIVSFFLKYISIMKAVHSNVVVVVIRVFFYILYNGHGNS